MSNVQSIISWVIIEYISRQFFDQAPIPEDESGKQQPAGFQRILKLLGSGGDVTSLAIDDASSLVAAGNERGELCVVDVRQASFGFT